MILKDDEVQSRLDSPLNLVNQLNRIVNRSSSSMSIFVPQESNDEPLAVDESMIDIVDDKKLRLGLARSLALDVMHDSLNHLHKRLPEITKVKDLSTIARDMKTILVEDESVNKNNTQVVIYKPIINDISKYDTMVVME